MHAEPLDRRTFTVREAAQVLGIGRDATYAAVQSGTIPSIRVGRRVVIPREAIGRILAQGRSCQGRRRPNPIVTAWLGWGRASVHRTAKKHPLPKPCAAPAPCWPWSASLPAARQ
jgi:excisionase family DNA binding protein